ncbi:uncharacterized protein LOC122365242 [Amphibalanus amphitrite]|uniref:uncharacterized protein LOC122365242 n=1 Tax=Amphibalanus amphitrite TaxID=1232801 RepID=UPI001C9172C6|nr:uncharacterized protein LOC122365242 [Amphibalanus amphitrite]
MSYTGTGTCRFGKPDVISATETSRKDREGACRHPAPSRRSSRGPTRALLLALLCVLVTAASAKSMPKCRIHPFHPWCRGVASRAHPDRDSLSPLSGARLSTLLRKYIRADSRRTRAMESLSEFLKEERPALADPTRDSDTLLRRLLRTARDSQNDGAVFG